MANLHSLMALIQTGVLGASATLDAKLRALSPTVDPRSHTALVYADLPPDAHRAASAGMSADDGLHSQTTPATDSKHRAVVQTTGDISFDRTAQVRKPSGVHVVSLHASHWTVVPLSSKTKYFY